MKKSLEDYTRVMRGRYARRTGKRGRGVLLYEYCQSTGLERKHANKVLRGQRRRESDGSVRGARSRDTADDIAVLKGAWLASWEKHHGALQRRHLENISAAQPERSGDSQPQAARRASGAMQVDTVALCGGSLSGAIIWALDSTDIHSRWTEVRAVWNRGAHATRGRLSEVEEALPFALRKLDFDNGTEFLNAHFISHFKAHEPGVELSRSRPYRKNDNAHMEQKNCTHVRLLLGDDRFGHMELVEPLNEVLREWSLWNNLFGAQRRLLRKERRPDGKVKRHHEKRASTPCARLLAHEDLGVEQSRKLKALLKQHDPIGMKERIESKLKAVHE